MAKIPIIGDWPDWLSETPNLTELAKGSTVWLAVTGLSRAGKTVFITSLVHNLLSALHNPNRMPLLQAVGEGRLIAAQLEAARAHTLPRFPYAANIEAMAGTPSVWPEPTADISEIGVDIRFAPTGLVGQLLGSIGGSAATLKLRIVDYPGEWLLDLPLLSQSYADWSRATLALWKRGLRADIARDFIAFAGEHPASEIASDAVAKEAHDLYRALLVTARDKHGLSYLQPGRFVRPGVLADAPYLWFAPLEVADGVDRFSAGSLGGLMQERFEVYKREVVEKFYADYFRNYGRQIVLVDVLGALLAGREAFEDTRLATEAILQSFRYGQHNILTRILGASRVEKVLFAATKADHIPDRQREHMSALLRNMAALPVLSARGRDADIEVMSLASVASTIEATQVIDGRDVEVVVGRKVGSAKQAKFLSGEVPVRPPRPDQWGTPFLDVPVFEPPLIDPAPVDGIPHINLDLALDYLIGDRLQ
ncbi:YcjX family protein [Pseudolabrys sp. FHR47]|uniref:YcjX family protein n=1 Tax=Pseudolabrys sp. FHR47 TaxID=2562284 RepID=UPI0010BEFB44|nr:YcjX family protein [Pseudolabrys sp. FHR47]